ncbi:MAG: RDD family protein [Owenweeksia sp.]
MQSINIQTTQNVVLQYSLAGLGHRIAAILIDFTVLLAFSFSWQFITGRLFGAGSMTLNVILGIINLLYFLVCEISMNGQTIGKKAMRIKVVKTDGSKPGISAYILRWIMIPIDYSIAGGVAMIFIILTRKAQRLGDIIAGTTVVLVKGKDQTLQKKKAIIGSVDENYTPVFPEAARLSMDDISLMRQVLDAFQERSQRDPMEILKKKIEEKLQISTDLHPIKFFHTLIKDHTYYSWRNQ